MNPARYDSMRDHNMIQFGSYSYAPKKKYKCHFWQYKVQSMEKVNIISTSPYLPVNGLRSNPCFFSRALGFSNGQTWRRLLGPTGLLQPQGPAISGRICTACSRTDLRVTRIPFGDDFGTIDVVVVVILCLIYWILLYCYSRFFAIRIPIIFYCTSMYVPKNCAYWTS